MKKYTQLPLDFPKVISFGRDNFFVNNSNALAVKLIEKFPHWNYFAQLIYGESGCGKTHLSRILGELTDDITFINGKDLASSTVPQTKTVVVDNMQNANQEALFHLYNMMKDRGFLLLTAEHPVNRMNFTLPDLTSRLMTVPAIEILPPDDSLIMAFLIKNFDDLGLDISTESLQFLLKNTERSYSAIKKLVERADFLSRSEKRKLTIPLLKDALGQS